MVINLWRILEIKFPAGFDARSYIMASKALRLGLNPYEEATYAVIPPLATTPKYIYPPLLAFFLTPLSYLPLIEATYFLIAILILIVIYIALLFRQYIGNYLGLFSVLLFPPIWEAVYFGQCDILILPLIFGMYLSIEGERPVKASTILALATLLKISPVTLFPIFFKLRDPLKPIIFFLISALSLIILTLPSAPLSTWIHGFTKALRLDWGSPEFLSWTGIIYYHLGPRSAEMTLALSGLCVVLTLLRVSRIPKCFGFSALLFLPLLIVRITWYHHFVLILPALISIYKQSTPGRIFSITAWFMFACLSGPLLPIVSTVCWAASCWPHSFHLMKDSQQEEGPF